MRNRLVSLIAGVTFVIGSVAIPQVAAADSSWDGGGGCPDKVTAPAASPASGAAVAASTPQDSSWE